MGTIDRVRQDLRYAWRMILKHPAFSLAVVGTLALGIGGATTMFAVVDGVLLKPLPYPNGDRIVRIGRTFGGVRVSSTSAPDFNALASQSATLAHVGVAREESVDVTGGGIPERAAAAVVSASYFQALGVSPARGQLFSAPDDRAGARQIAVISDAMWRRRFGAADDAVGRSFLINNEPHTIAGVMPRGFRGPEALGQERVDIWLPLGRLKLSQDPDEASLGTIAAIAAGIAPAAAWQEIERIGGPNHFWMSPLREETIGDNASGLWLLFGAVSLLLLLACSNIANLFLMRATERTREIAVRTAIGAGRARIARQLVTETLCFGLAGGALAVVLAYGGVALVRAWSPADLPRVGDLHVDVRVLAFASLVAALAGVLFGAMPAMAARRSDFSGILRSAQGSTTGAGHLRQRGLLVVIQTALAAMLVVGASLLGNSVLRLSRVDPGFDPSNVVWLDITLPERAYTGAAPKLAFFDEVLRRTHTVPGVESASVVQGRPLGGGNSVATVAPEGALPAEGEQAPRVPFHVVASGYFEALRIPRLEGRDFAESDRASSPRVAAVSRAFAKKFWPGQSAVGKRFWMGRVAADAPLTEVVGVVEDVRQYGLGEEPIPMVYRALAQVPRASATLVIRHDGRSLADAIEQTRSTIWSLDSALPLDRAGTMDAQVSESIREPRFRAIALSAFGLLACVIACVGLYGALAWLVRARSREFGVRAALGASPDELRGLIVRRGLTLAGAGIALGLIAASFAAGFLSSMVFGISPTDAPTFAVAAVTMVLVAFAACWIPARRAASVNPHVILRD